MKLATLTLQRISGAPDITLSFLHPDSMGLADEYRESPRAPNGDRTIVRTGPSGGLMGYIDPGSRPTPGNFNDLVNGRRP